MTQKSEKCTVNFDKGSEVGDGKNSGIPVPKSAYVCCGENFF